MIVTSPTGASTPLTVIAQSSDWRTAVTDLLAWMVANGRCFSSGEIAAYLRTNRSDLAFKVGGVGEFVREAYDNGRFPSYSDTAGNSVYPTQVPRTTNGVARTLDGRTVESKTAAGQAVFVYAIDGAEGFAHDFEVYIPDYDDPQATKAIDYTGAPPVAPTVTTTPSATPGASPVTSAPPSQATGVLITGSLKRDDLIAYVRPDRRLCVPRAAFEAFVALTGTPLRGGPNGDPVYIDFMGDEVVITRDPSATGTSTAYHLWATRGRVAFLAATGLPTFDPGDKYEITVRQDALVVNLTKKV
jgi:hypothetical protein